jgi:hypothetical protein
MNDNITLSSIPARASFTTSEVHAESFMSGGNAFFSGLLDSGLVSSGVIADVLAGDWAVVEAAFVSVGVTGLASFCA